MTRLEAVLTTLQHREPEIVPCMEDFSDDNAQARFAPEWQTDDPLEREIAYAELMDNCFAGAGGGGLRCTVTERTPKGYVQQWENGARWHIHTRPGWWREYVHYPISDLAADLDRVAWPDPDDPARYAGVAAKAKALREAGLFTQGGLNGFFSGVWYFWRPFDAFMVDMLETPSLAHELVRRVAEFNLRAAERLLACGVQSIAFPDDLGYNTATFMSPRLYREYFFPWHRRLAALCHDFGAVVNMHSHGNINGILPLLADARIDILNPVGPSDGMDLAALKARYGDRMAFQGGVSKHIGRMRPRELRAHLLAVFRSGAPGGGYICHSEGGIPADMPRANVYLYLLLRRQCARMFGRRRTASG